MGSSVEQGPRLVGMSMLELKQFKHEHGLMDMQI